MKKNKRFDYDLIVIGSGAGGSVAAHIANKSGLSVAIIEAELIGGECPNIGCVPTKALLQAAEIYEASKKSSKFGIRGVTVSYNYPSIKAWKDLAVKRTGTYLGEEIYSKEGIHVIHGRAHFINPNEVTVGRARYSAKNFIIAAGGELAIPPIEGLEKTKYLTSTEAINLLRPPKSIAIIGGGAIGCEFTQLFASFGTKVHIIDQAPRLLFREEPEAGEYLQRHFETGYSSSIHLESIIEKAEIYGNKKRLTIKDTRGQKNIITVDEILIATGKRASLDIGLENAGVQYNNRGIEVNLYLQTSTKHIFAAGDCVGPYQFTHTATYQSRIVANNILHPRKLQSTDYRAVPRCIFTNPEIASVGPTEQELKEKGIKYKVVNVPITVIGRANTADVGEGFVKVIASTKNGMLLSATIVSPHAGEMIHELTLAIQNDLSATQVANTIHAFPTWSEAVKVACTKLSKI